jgi:electron transfer flavoprotein alpha subunit
MNQDIFVMIEHLQGQTAEISYLMLAAGKAIREATGGEVVAILLGKNARDLASDLAADRVIYVDHPALADYTCDSYIQVLSELLGERSSRLVLFGDTSIGVEVAGPLSMRLGLPLVSNCRQIHADEGKLKFTSQSCGGKILVEGELPAPTALVTMIPGGYKPELGRSSAPPNIETAQVEVMEKGRLQLKQYIEPETGDVDIAKEPVLVAVGRGIQNQDNLALAEELASALGGVVCSSRPVVDQGWLPSTRLVGKSGKRVKPKLYLALGISGAPEHVEAIGNSEVIVAINTDPQAPIFEIAQYGAEMDVLDLLPALTEAVTKVRVG